MKAAGAEEQTVQSLEHTCLQNSCWDSCEHSLGTATERILFECIAEADCIAEANTAFERSAGKCAALKGSACFADNCTASEGSDGANCCVPTQNHVTCALHVVRSLVDRGAMQVESFVAQMRVESFVA